MGVVALMFLIKKYSPVT